MSDLISRSEAVQRIIKETVDSKNNLIHINTVKRLLQDVDTSYDIDKVVEQLEEKIVITWKHDYDGGRKDAFNEAIGIVKQGFVGTETGIEAETIRDKAVKWNNRSTKKVPYEFIEFVEGKRTIDAEDDGVIPDAHPVAVILAEGCSDHVAALRQVRHEIAAARRLAERLPVGQHHRRARLLRRTGLRLRALEDICRRKRHKRHVDTRAVLIRL